MGFKGMRLMRSALSRTEELVFRLSVSLDGEHFVKVLFIYGIFPVLKKKNSNL